MSKPRCTGWFWFLPDENCPTPTGLLRIDRPVVLLVGQEKYTRDGPPARLVIRFSTGTMFVDDLSGDWELIREPKFIQRKVLQRFKKKMQQSKETE